MPIALNVGNIQVVHPKLFCAFLSMPPLCYLYFSLNSLGFNLGSCLLGNASLSGCTFCYVTLGWPLGTVNLAIHFRLPYMQRGKHKPFTVKSFSLFLRKRMPNKINRIIYSSVYLYRYGVGFVKPSPFKWTVAGLKSTQRNSGQAHQLSS